MWSYHSHSLPHTSTSPTLYLRPFMVHVKFAAIIAFSLIPYPSLDFQVLSDPNIPNSSNV